MARDVSEYKDMMYALSGQGWPRIAGPLTGRVVRISLLMHRLYIIVCEPKM